jgi:hypothetical protein
MMKEGNYEFQVCILADAPADWAFFGRMRRAAGEEGFSSPNLLMVLLARALRTITIMQLLVMKNNRFGKKLGDGDKAAYFS